MPDPCEGLLAKLRALGCYALRLTERLDHEAEAPLLEAPLVEISSYGAVSLDYRRRCPLCEVRFGLARQAVGESREQVLRAALDYEWSVEDRCPNTEPAT